MACLGAFCFLLCFWYFEAAWQTVFEGVLVWRFERWNWPVLRFPRLRCNIGPGSTSRATQTCCCAFLKKLLMSPSLWALCRYGMKGWVRGSTIENVRLGLRSRMNAWSLSTLNQLYTMSYQVPRKAILSKEQLQYFQESQTHKDIVSYIETMNDAVIGSRLTDECSTSPVSIMLLLAFGQETYEWLGCYSYFRFAQSSGENSKGNPACG